MEQSLKEISKILRVPVQSRTSAQIEYIKNLTKNIQFFIKLKAEQGSDLAHKECCKVMNLEEYEENQTVFRYGDKGDKFYIILSGKVSIQIPVKKNFLLSKNFAQKIDKNLKEESSVQNTENRQSLINMGQNDPHKRDQEDYYNIINEETHILNLIKMKSKLEQKALIDAIKNSEDKLEIELQDSCEIDVLESGASFGELALLSDKPRAASIVPLQQCSFLVLNKADFSKILGEIAEKKLNSVIEFLQKVPYFHSRSKTMLLRMALYFQPKKFNKDSEIFKEKDPVDGIYFIREGEVTISKKQFMTASQSSIFSSSPPDFKSKQPRKMTRSLEVKIVIKSKFESFGGFEVISQKDFRSYSCICSSYSCEVLFVPRSSFMSRIPYLDLFKDMIIEEHERVMKRYQEIISINAQKTEQSRSYTPDLLSQKNLFPSSRVKRNQSISRQKLNSDNVLYRRMTKKQISEAVNGRDSIMRKYGSKAQINSSFTAVQNHRLKKLTSSRLIKNYNFPYG